MNNKSNEDSAKLWGGRFERGPDEMFAEFNDSFRFDRRLFFADVTASVAHANGLAKANILSASESSAIVDELNRLADLAKTDPHFFDDSAAEDIHSFIEGKLCDALGDTGRKIHTGRSRNDQVATSFRIWMRDEIGHIDADIKSVQTALVHLADRHPNAAIPGYTHLQRAQPVLFAHWCLAYFEMLRRDRERLTDVRKRVNVMPLGSGALAGTGFAIDREAVAAELGFADVSRNSLDAVSDRDFTVELTCAASLTMVHLSRLAEDVILYCATEFGFLTLSDAVSTGSSMMPQKKNPDALELIRGKAGRVFGHNMSLLTMLKGLPLAYNKDMQEDKEAIFDTVDTVRLCLKVAALVLDNAFLNETTARDAAITGHTNATELADYLVKKGVPFRTAHEIVGIAVLEAIKQRKELQDLPLELLQTLSGDIDADVLNALKLDAALAAKDTPGGTAPRHVSQALIKAKDYLQITRSNPPR